MRLVLPFLAMIALLFLPATINAQSPLIYDGFTEPVADIMVSGSELGRIENIHVKMGDYVHEGDSLAQMDDSLQRMALEIANAQATQTGEIDVATAELDLYQTRTETLRRLAKDGMARPDELRRSETDLRLANARVKMAQEQQRLRQLEVKRSELQLKRRHLVAPATGMIARVLHAPGEYITPADAVIFRLIVVDNLEAVFNIPVEEIAQTQTGDVVQVFLQSQSKTIQGTVDRVSPSIDGESGTIQVRVLIANPERIYRSGDRCTLQLIPRQHRRSTASRPAVDVSPVGRELLIDVDGRANSREQREATVKPPRKRQAIARSWLETSPQQESTRQ